MSMFVRSSELRSKKTYHVLAWGSEGSGKSHLAHSAPGLAMIDFEHRSSAFRDTYEFFEVTPSSVTDGLKAIAEIVAGRVPCESVAVDGLTRPYEAMIRRFTTTNTNDGGKRTAITDWVSVNRESQNMMDAIFSLAGKNIICTAKQGSKLVKEGRDFRRDGVHMIGDGNRWPYYFDYVLHHTARGCIRVQKSMSIHLPVGTDIRGDLDWARLMRLVIGEESVDGKPLRPVPDPVPVRQEVGGDPCPACNLRRGHKADCPEAA